MAVEPTRIAFAVALTLGSALLFVIEPMLGKMLLPALGSAPAVWTTCMLFFQAALLVGYGYAHGVSAWLGPRRQAALHVALLGIAALALPVTFRGALESVPSETDPTGWLLVSLIKAAGPAFVVVAGTAPSLQNWFAHTRGRGAQDPYFLYAASNVGSLAGLLAYPLLIEPVWTLPQQAELWTAGYALLVVLVVVCAGSLWGSPEPASATAKALADPGLARRALWVALSFVPSSLMLGATTYITTDLAAIPLLWMVPLALYLVTLVLAFSMSLRGRWLRGLFTGRALCALSLPLLVAVLTDATSPAAILIPLHLLTLFLAAGACHAELAAERPPPAHLTEYYLWISLGGALGGVFNAAVAPLLFRSVAEYPLAIVLACLLGRRSAARRRGVWPSRQDWAFAAALGLLIALATHWARAAGPATSRPAQLLVYLVPALVCYRFVERPWRFALGLGAIVLNGLIAPLTPGTIVHAERNFFGIVRVRHVAEERFHDLVHGNTIHGRQSLEAADRREPLSYYHRRGPLGQVFTVIDAGKPMGNIAVIGLGAGAVSAYATPAQTWEFYEINPAVASVARDPRYFTFLRDCRAARAPRIIVGDARLQLGRAPSHGYDVILLDAFSSDSIPLHLLTREALSLYLDKLAADGTLVFHVSQRLLDIGPVLAALADDAGLMGRVRDDLSGGPIELARGQDVSRWIVVARREIDLGEMAADPRWRPLPGKGARVWTDDYSNVLGAVRGSALFTELANAARQW